MMKRSMNCLARRHDDDHVMRFPGLTVRPGNRLRSTGHSCLVAADHGNAPREARQCDGRGRTRRVRPRPVISGRVMRETALLSRRGFTGARSAQERCRSTKAVLSTYTDFELQRSRSVQDRCRTRSLGQAPRKDPDASTEPVRTGPVQAAIPAYASPAWCGFNGAGPYETGAEGVELVPFGFAHAASTEPVRTGPVQGQVTCGYDSALWPDHPVRVRFGVINARLGFGTCPGVGAYRWFRSCVVGDAER